MNNLKAKKGLIVALSSATSTGQNSGVTVQIQSGTENLRQVAQQRDSNAEN